MILKLRFLIITGILLFSPCTFSQNKETDALLFELKQATQDSTKVRLSLTIGELIYSDQPDSAYQLFLNASKICEKYKQKYSSKKVKKSNALAYFFSFNMASAYYDMGYVSLVNGNVPNGLEYYHKCLKIQENTLSPETQKPDYTGISQTLNDIGVIYSNQKDWEEALKYYGKSMKLRKKLNDPRGVAQLLNNIGVVWKNQGSLAKALENYKSALKIQEAVSDKEGLAYTLNNIAAVYKDSGDPNCTEQTEECLKRGTEKALEYLLRGLKMHEEIKDKAGIAYSKNNIAVVLLKLKKYNEALLYAKSSLQLGKEIGSPDIISRSSQTLSKLYAQSGEYKNAYEMQTLFKQMADSINNENNRKSSIKREFEYMYEKKVAADSIQSLEERKIFAVQMHQEKSQRLLLYVGIVLITLFSGFIYNRFRITRKQKNIIELQKTEVEKQKEIIEEKNRNITDSINYAERIQQAKLPRLEDIYAALPNSFVLFKPKDIVSGDFYFFHRNEDKIFIAAADCTGHGVPGALMSMVGSEQLNDSVKQYSSESEILRSVNRGIKKSLRQSDREESTRDGMDIAFCSIDTETLTIRFAGANRPLWIIRKNQSEPEEIKPTKKSIGGLTDDDQHFDTHTLQLEQGDTVYLTTDGYADTFGGKHSKKLTSKKFKQILMDIQEQNMQEQKQYLDTFIEEWKAGSEQIDDILVIGFRL